MRDTRFWNASGIDLSMNAGGLTLRTQSLISVATGGIAFASMSEDGSHAEDAGQVFELYPSEQQARAQPDGVGYRLRLRSEEKTYELQALIRISYADLCLKHT